MNDDVRKAIDEAPTAPERDVAQARFVLGSHWELDLTDPKVMVAAMAGASYVKYLADRLYQAGAVDAAGHAMIGRVSDAAQDVWANAVRFLEREAEQARREKAAVDAVYGKWLAQGPDYQPSPVEHERDLAVLRTAQGRD